MGCAPAPTVANPAGRCASSSGRIASRQEPYARAPSGTASTAHSFANNSPNAAGMFFVIGQYTRASAERRMLETHDFNRLPSPPVSVDTTRSLLVIDARVDWIVGDLTCARARVHGFGFAERVKCILRAW